MQQQSRVRDGSDLQLDLQIPTQNQGLIYRQTGRASVRTRQHSGTCKQTKQNHRRRMTTYRHVTPPTREVHPRLKRILEAGHRPLAVSGAPCRDFIQHQVLDATDEAIRSRNLRSARTHT